MKNKGVGFWALIMLVTIIVNAIKAKEYNAWKEAMSTQLTKNNFNKLVKRHKAMSERQAQRESMETVIQERDYEAWKKAAENSSVNSSKILDEVDEDNVKILVHLYRAELKGNFAFCQES